MLSCGFCRAELLARYPASRIRARAEEHPPEPRERGILLLQQPDEVEQGAEQAVEQLEVLLAEAAAPEPIAQSFNLRPAG